METMRRAHVAVVAAGGVLVGVLVGGAGVGMVMYQPDPDPVVVEVESPALDVCRGMAFNLANEVYQLVGLVAAERAGESALVDERLDMHMTNWAEKVEGVAPVCGIELPGEL